MYGTREMYFFPPPRINVFVYWEREYNSLRTIVPLNFRLQVHAFEGFYLAGRINFPEIKRGSLRASELNFKCSVSKFNQEKYRGRRKKLNDYGYLVCGPLRTSLYLSRGGKSLLRDPKCRCDFVYTWCKKHQPCSAHTPSKSGSTPRSCHT